MSKRMKKLIGMLLSVTMIASSVGMIALADEADTTSTDAAQAEETVAPVETEDSDATPEPAEAANDSAGKDIDEADGDDAEVTGATEAPAAEIATPEPTEAPKKYESDSYYKRSLALVTALGVFEGNENGDMQPESNVTRAQMAAIVLRMLNAPASGAYAGGFNDVSADHWASKEIQAAQALGIINGFEDGSFRPDGDVTYEQVVKMIVAALGYEAQAQYSGGYPAGYLSQANSLKLNDSAMGINGVAAERGLVIKMVYNALLTYYNELSGIDAAGYNVYEATRTLAKAKFNVVDANGILTATPNKTIDQSLSELRDGAIAIDGTIYDTELTGIDEFVGTEITYFYRETFGALNPEVLAVTAKRSSKTEKVVVNLDNVNRLSGFETGNGVIEMDKGSNYRCPDAVINYNGAVITAAEYSSAVQNDKQGKFNKKNYDGTDLGITKTFDEFLLPDQGTIEITDLDGDGKYDYIFVEAYETMLVTSVSSKTLAGKINNADRTFSVDMDSNQELKVTVKRGGSEVRARNLNSDDVASVMESLDGNTLKITVTGESVTGTVSSTSVEDDKFTALIDGTRYVVDANAISSIATGSEGTFYLDMFDRIGYATSSGGGRLSGNEKYGWLMNAYVDDDGSTYRVKIFTQDGKAEIYELASTVNFWSPKESSSKTLSGDNRKEIQQMVNQGNFQMAGGSYQIRLCKFRANTNGLVNMIYMATDASVVDDNNAVIVDTKNLRGVGSVGVTVNGRTISDGITGFRVPQTASDMNSDSEYSTFNVNSGSYVTVLGVQTDFVVGEFTNGRDANVLIQFATSANVAAQISDYGTVDDNPVMVVTGIDIGTDSEGETVYYIVGRRNGGEVSYPTTRNTLLVKSTDAFLSGNGSTASYPNKKLWDAISNKDSIANYLNPGDVVGVKSDASGARILIKFVDIKELAARVATGDTSQYLGYNSASETRDGYGLGAVANIDTSGDTYFTMVDQNGTSIGHSWYFPSSTAIDFVDVTTDDKGLVSAKVSKEVYEPSEMMNFNTRNKIGDFVFSRNFRNNAQREAIVFRFNDN